MKNIPISTATPAQVRRFAALVGIEVLDGHSDDTVLGNLRKAWTSDMISVADEEDEIQSGFLGGDIRYAPEDREPGQSSEFSERSQARRVDNSSARDDPRVVLNLQKVRVGNEVSNADVSVGVNGVVWQLKTGIRLDVPMRVYEALNNAIRNEVTHDADGEVIEAEVHAYPFNVIEQPSRAEVQRWHEMTDDRVLN